MMLRAIHLILFVSFGTIILGCVSGYQTFYIPTPGATPEAIKSSRLSPPPASPVVEKYAFVGNDLIHSYARKGYSLIGYSQFSSGRQERDYNAVAQGVAVGADLVLISNPRFERTNTAVVPITSPTTSTSYSSDSANIYGPGGSATVSGSSTTTRYGSNTNYIPVSVNVNTYTATYFIKAKYRLGVKFRDLNQSERLSLGRNTGAVVSVLIEDTPAFYADVLEGDVFEMVNNEKVLSSKQVLQQFARLKGHEVSVVINRNGTLITKKIALGE